MYAIRSYYGPLTIPGGRMRLVHRVLEIDPAGGRCGIGVIRAEADIHPDDWFLTCHFVDDRVMPGTLMYRITSYNVCYTKLLRQGIEAVEGCAPNGIVATVKAATKPESWIRQPLRSSWIV